MWRSLRWVEASDREAGGSAIQFATPLSVYSLVPARRDLFQFAKKNLGGHLRHLAMDVIGDRLQTAHAHHAQRLDERKAFHDVAINGQRFLGRCSRKNVRQ